MSRNLRLLVSYDGTDFSGWQLQKDDRSVQGVLQAALADLLGTPTSLIGAGRTDAGVHASGQVCNFRTDNQSIPAGRFRDAINARLPRDIRVLDSTEVPHSFHARYDAVSRQYEYRMVSGPAAPAHLVRYTWLIRRFPPVDLLNGMAREICGTHDFTTFASAGDPNRSRIRHMEHAVFLADGPLLLFRIRGNAFLWRMVRSLLGTMIDLAGRGVASEAFRSIIESRDRNAAGPTAPARGLFLTGVFYGPQ